MEREPPVEEADLVLENDGILGYTSANFQEAILGDVERGLLGLGKIQISPEDMAKVQTEARNKMMEKLENENTLAVAERFAKMSVWEIYQPIVNTVTTGYSLVIDME